MQSACRPYRPLHRYSLSPIQNNARLGAHVGFDTWNLTTATGGTIKAALYSTMTVLPANETAPELYPVSARAQQCMATCKSHMRRSSLMRRRTTPPRCCSSGTDRSATRSGACARVVVWDGRHCCSYVERWREELGCPHAVPGSADPWGAIMIPKHVLLFA